MASRFWVGGTGTWDAADTTHWSATSGGSGGASVPGSSDTVTFDTNSGASAVVTLSTSPTVQSVTRTGTVALTLTLGSSNITVNTTDWNFETTTNLTVTANTATVTLTGAGAVAFRSAGTFNWNGLSVVYTGAGLADWRSDGTVANLTRTGTAVTGDGLRFIRSPTVTGTATFTGNSATNRLLVYSDTLGTARTITAATTSLTNVDFRDITAAGAAAWTGTSIGNALGNTGITFTTPVTRYAVATGNVSGTGTWSATSGGASGASVPLCHDTMVLNAASGAITVTNDMPRMCADLTCTGFTGTLTWAATQVYGSITLGSGMTVTGAVVVGLYGRSSHTITSAGKTWPCNLNLYGNGASGGTYTLTDAYASSASLGGATLALVGGGTFDDGGFAVTMSGANSGWSQFAGTLTASGTWTLATTTSNATPWNYSAGTVNHTGVIVLSGATTLDRTFVGGGRTYGTLTDQNTSTGKLTVTGANTFGTINKTATVACTLALPTSSGITVTGQFNVQGTSTATLTLTGDVTKASGRVACEYLSISSSDASGGATFLAGRTSTDGGSNTGWQFVSLVNATMAAPLGTITGAMAATRKTAMTAAADLGTLTGTLAGTIKHPAVMASDLGALTAAINGTIKHPAVMAAALGELSAAIGTTTIKHPAVMAAALGALTANIDGTAFGPTTPATSTPTVVGLVESTSEAA